MISFSLIARIPIETDFASRSSLVQQRFSRLPRRFRTSRSRCTPTTMASYKHLKKLCDKKIANSRISLFSLIFHVRIAVSTVGTGLEESLLKAILFQ
jgi:hypothetical protein